MFQFRQLEHKEPVLTLQCKLGFLLRYLITAEMYRHVDFCKVSGTLIALFHLKMFWELKKKIYNHYIFKITFTGMVFFKFY